MNLVSSALEAAEAARWVCGGREEPEGCSSPGYLRALSTAGPVASHSRVFFPQLVIMIYFIL